jgi:hypothetical protein
MIDSLSFVIVSSVSSDLLTSAIVQRIMSAGEIIGSFTIFIFVAVIHSPIFMMFVQYVELAAQGVLPRYIVVPCVIPV